MPDAHSRSLPTRRAVLAGATMSALAWSTPSIVGLSPVAAASGSCLPFQVNWTSGFRAGSQYVLRGSSGSIAIQAVVTPQLSSGASRQVWLSGGRFGLAMWNHQIGDRWLVSFSFTSSSQTVCVAGLTILDVDQNGRGLGCGTNSRFRDEITSITGAGLVAVGQGALVEGPPGTWGSSIPCKTSNQENLDLTWNQPAGVTGTGFVWDAATPPGTSQTLDRQIILVSPVDICLSGAASGASVASRTAPDGEGAGAGGLPVALEGESIGSAGEVAD